MEGRESEASLGQPRREVYEVLGKEPLKVADVEKKTTMEIADLLENHFVGESGREPPPLSKMDLGLGSIVVEKEDRDLSSMVDSYLWRTLAEGRVPDTWPGTGEGDLKRLPENYPWDENTLRVALFGLTVNARRRLIEQPSFPDNLLAQEIFRENASVHTGLFTGPVHKRFRELQPQVVASGLLKVGAPDTLYTLLLLSAINRDRWGDVFLEQSQEFESDLYLQKEAESVGNQGEEVKEESQLQLAWKNAFGEIVPERWRDFELYRRDLEKAREGKFTLSEELRRVYLLHWDERYALEMVRNQMLTPDELATYLNRGPSSENASVALRSQIVLGREVIEVADVGSNKISLPTTDDPAERQGIIKKRLIRQIKKLNKETNGPSGTIMKIFERLRRSKKKKNEDVDKSSESVARLGDLLK